MRLRYFEQLSFPEIASRLDCIENTVKTRFYRGLKRLRQWLDEDSLIPEERPS